MTIPTKPVAEIVAEIPRFRLYNDGEWGMNQSPEPDGEYYRYSDVEPLFAELTRLTEENEQAVTLLLDAKPLFEQDSPGWMQWVLDVRAWLAKRGTNP